MELIGFLLAAGGTALVVALAINSELASYSGSRAKDMLGNLLWGIAIAALLAGIVLVSWSNPPQLMEVQHLKPQK